MIYMNLIANVSVLVYSEYMHSRQVGKLHNAANNIEESENK
jgi:hypothetical protein